MLKALLAALSLATFANAAPPEVRGTWITTTANDAIATPAKTEETMRRLREIGLNTVYVECWKNGYTEFPSPTLKKTIGVEMKVNGKDAVQRDLLGEAVIQAHRNGLLCTAWFEYGFMAAFKDTRNELRAKKDWLTTMPDGSDVSKENGMVWLNPFHPEVQAFLIDISLDAIRQYDLDGIQLDDRIALPVDLGYDPYTVALYQKEHAGQSPPPIPEGFYEKDEEKRKAIYKPSPAWKAWVQWRADKISEFGLRYVTEIRAARPDILISVSPAPHPWSLDNYCCDWMEWTKWCYCGGKRWNEYVPQCYRKDGATTIKSIQDQVERIGEEKVNLVPGIRVVGDGPDIKFDDLKRVLDFCRTSEVAGHVLWFSRGVLDVYPKELTAYYDVAKNGRAANPFKSADWRPLPIVATRDATAWKAKISQAGRYRVIAKKDGRWSETTTIDLTPGEQTFVHEAEAVELLVDRRP